MTTATTTKTTLVDLARAVNDLIETRPNSRNPRMDGSDSCLYHDPDTDERCLIGQALYNLTGWNVPAEFEEQGIESLFACGKFRRFFGLSVDPNAFGLEQAIVDAQGVADGGSRWGTLDLIPVDAD